MGIFLAKIEIVLRVIKGSGLILIPLVGVDNVSQENLENLSKSQGEYV